VDAERGVVDAEGAEVTANDLNDLLQKYPLLTQLRIRRLESGCNDENIPPYFACLLSVLEGPAGPPICFVFPRRGDAPRLASVVFALLRFKSRQTELALKLGQAKFRKGDVVRIHPGKHVYRYVGFDDANANLLGLGTLDGSGKWWVPPASIVPRLELTNARRPLGKLTTPILSPPPAPLDVLLGTTTFGNHSLISTELVLLDEQKAFRDFASTIAFSNGDTTPEQAALADLVPFGNLESPASNGDSWFEKWDARNPDGEPLIAVTHSPQVLSDYCLFAPAKSQVVVVNGGVRLKGLQAYDDISQMQRMVIFCDHADDEVIEGFANRGCQIWQLSGPELAPSEMEGRNFSPRSVILPVTKWAWNHDKLKVDDEPCGSSILDEMCLKLVGLDANVVDGDEHLPALLSRAWRLVNEAAALIVPPKDEQRASAREQICLLKAEITGNRAWLSPDAFQVLNETVAALENAYVPGSNLGVAKGAALYKLIQQARGQSERWVVLTRSPGQVPQVHLWLLQRGMQPDGRVVHARGLADDGSYDRVICISWPGGDTLEGVAGKLTSPRITVLSYTFERVWVRQATKRLSKSASTRRLTDNQKRALLGMKGIPEGETPAPGAPPVNALTPDADIWAFERRLRQARKDGGAAAQGLDTIQARYVGFIGDSYVYLTETHKVSVATELLTKRQKSGARLPERVVTELVAGDFVIFPESSDREMVYELADKLLAERASGLRKLAHVWKDALAGSGMSPEAFLRQAKDLKRARHIATVRNWFAETSQIGPGLSNEDLTEDLELIALVTGHAGLEKDKDRIREAIKELRSAHLSAGMRLRDVLLDKLPAVIGLIEENGTRIDLGELGSAWMVQIENVASEPELRERSQVNRLLRGTQANDLLAGLLV